VTAPRRHRRAAATAAAAAVLAWVSCAGPPPPDVLIETSTLSHPLYEDWHILELSAQVRDLAPKASREAEARVERDTPDYGPLKSATSLGLRVMYRVTVIENGYHHWISMDRPGEPLDEDAALNLLRFVTDLMGVEVDQAARDQTWAYVLAFDLGAAEQAVVLGNLETRLERDDVLRTWREAVLNQVSARPIRLDEGGGP